MPATARAFIAERARRGGGRRSISRRLHRARQGRRLRHRPRPRLRLLGLGRRALFDLVGDRPAADDRHRPRAISAQFLAGAQRHGPAFPDGAAGARTCRCCSASSAVWHRNVLGYRDPRDPALRPAAVALPGLSAAARHGIERQARRSTARRVDADRPGRLGRARHQRPARLLPADPPGHRRRSRPSSSSPPAATSRISRHHHQLLIANCLAQSEALMKGRTLDEAEAAAARQGRRRGRRRAHRAAPGVSRQPPLDHHRLPPARPRSRSAGWSRSTSTGSSSKAQLFGINSFDQWGVELGKELATGLLPVVTGQIAAAGRTARRPASSAPFAR